MHTRASGHQSLPSSGVQGQFMSSLCSSLMQTDDPTYFNALRIRRRSGVLYERAESVETDSGLPMLVTRCVLHACVCGGFHVWFRQKNTPTPRDLLMLIMQAVSRR